MDDLPQKPGCRTFPQGPGAFPHRATSTGHDGMTEEISNLRQSIRIGFNEDFFPFAYGSSEHCAGMVIDIAKTIFTDVGLQIQWIPLNTGNIQEQLGQNNLDIIAGVAINDERNKQIRFSEPILLTGGAWFMACGSSTHHLPPKRVSTPGTGPLGAIINQQYPDIEVVTTENYSTAMQDVLSGAVDATALNFHVGRYIAVRDFPKLFMLPEVPFHTLPLAMAFSDAVPDALINEINGSLQALRNNGSLQRLTATFLRT